MMIDRLSCEPRSPHGGTGGGHFARLFGFFGSRCAAQVAHLEPPTLDSVAFSVAVFRSPTLPGAPLIAVFALCVDPVKVCEATALAALTLTGSAQSATLSLWGAGD